MSSMPSFARAKRVWVPLCVGLVMLGGRASAQPSQTTRESAVSQPAGEGSEQGLGESFSADPGTGVATASVPFTLPPGRAGLTPSLGLSYSSSQGDSAAGLGFGFEPPAIARRSDKGLPRYLDAAAWQPEEDTFVLGASELLPISQSTAQSFDGGPAPADLTGFAQYRQSVEGQLYRFYRAPDLSRWVVQTPQGHRLDFGRLPAGEGPADLDSSRALEVSPTGQVYRWLLTRTADSHGSTTYYVYSGQAAERHLADVYYTSPARCASVDPETARRCTAPLADYAVRVRFVYEPRPDATSAYRSGFEIRLSQRLKRVEVTCAQDSVGTRYLVRRYHLRYLPASYHSLLSEVQLEGRPETDAAGTGAKVGRLNIAESALSDAVVGVTAAPIRFRYTGEEKLQSGVAGFPGIDVTLHESAASPKYGVSDAEAELQDVNADGLPDLLVTDPNRFPATSGGTPRFGVYYNGFAGVQANPAAPGSFSEAVPLALPSVDASSLYRLSSTKVAPMDVVGDGVADLMRLPGLSKYGFLASVQSPSSSISPAQREHRLVQVSIDVPPGQQDGRIDFASEPARLRFIDANGDGLFDIVRTSGSALQTWLNLGRYPGGGGRFGTAHHDGTAWRLSSVPIEQCLPYDDQALDFRDPSVQLVDMNGDGLSDIVRRSARRVAYWPGSGNGRFGTASGHCELGRLRDAQLVMLNVPTSIDPASSQVLLADVDADGLADLMWLRSTRMDIAYNQGGERFTMPLLVNGLPNVQQMTARVRLLDMDGTGTADLVYADAKHFMWLDPLGGKRHRLLREVDNGRGALTRFEYTTSAREYLRDLAAAAACTGPSCDRFTWGEPGAGCDPLFSIAGTCAQRPAGVRSTLTLVHAVETTDRLDVLGLPAHVERTSYAYHEPYFDGVERVFRGFRVSDVIAEGEDAQHTSVTRTYTHRGERPFDMVSDATQQNPNESLIGQPLRVERFSSEGRRLSDVYMSYRVRRLLPGANGRWSYQALSVRTDRVTYSAVGSVVPPNAGAAVTSGVSQISRESLVLANGTFTSDAHYPAPELSIPLRDARYAHMVDTVDEHDRFGRALRQTAHGRAHGEFGEPLPDERIVTRSAYTLVHPGRWIWRVAESWLEDPATSFRLSHVERSFDPSTGDWVVETGHVTLPASFEFAGDAYGALSFQQSAEDLITSRTTDAWGNTLLSCGGADLRASPGACLRTTQRSYDDAYLSLLVIEEAATGVGGAPVLRKQTRWDRGLATVTSTTDENGQVSEVGYDGLGRPSFERRPSAQGCTGSTVPNTRMVYHDTTNPSAEPLSYTETIVEMSCAALGAESIRSRAYVDGLGRLRAQLTQAESPHAWTRSGVVELDPRGFVRRAYQTDFFDLPSPSAAQVLVAPTTPSSWTSYDPYGRVQCVRDELEQLSCTSYHALSQDHCDPLDHSDDPQHAGTCTTIRHDGHGREIDQVLRARADAWSDIRYSRLWTRYRADGTLFEMTRAETTNDAPRIQSTVVDNHLATRKFVVDSQGRRLASSDADTDARRSTATDGNRTYRYLHNRLGDLVAMRDPRGCGSNYFFDGLGRSVGEQRVACGEALVEDAASQTLPAGALALGRVSGTIKVHARSFFDAYPAWAQQIGVPSSAAPVLGRQTAQADPSQRTVFAYDARGNPVWSARQMALLAPANALTQQAAVPPKSLTSAAPLRAVAFDEAHTYVRTTSYDHAGRVRSLELPGHASDAEGGMTAPVRGEIAYNARQLPMSLSVVLNGQFHPVVAMTKYTRDGLAEDTLLGDGSPTRGGTHIVTTYDDHRRPIRSAVTRVPTNLPSPTRSLSQVSVVVDQGFVWDEADNLVELSDLRPATEWPDGYRPQSVSIEHDGLYRVSRAELSYRRDDGASATFDEARDFRVALASLSDIDPMHKSAAPSIAGVLPGRVVSLTWDSDWLGNVTDMTDDADAFYERSLGRVTNGADEPLGRPSAIRFASNLPVLSHPPSPSLDRGGYAVVNYGEGGLLANLTIHGQCFDKSSKTACWDDPSQGVAAREALLLARCNCAAEQAYTYGWDEGAHLVEARRYDRMGDSWSLAARMRYRYDAAGVRALKSTSTEDGELVALFVYPGDFERRGLLGATDRYIDAPTSETQYLLGGARVVWTAGAPIPSVDPEHRITYALPDLVGTTSAVLDLRRGELLETSSYYPNGAQETLRVRDDVEIPVEPNGFSGKEADAEVGLTYFGQRYLLPYLGRWASPDPLEIHNEDGGEALNNYHYISGNLLKGRDPLGLKDESAALIFAKSLDKKRTEQEKMNDVIEYLNTYDPWSPIEKGAGERLPVAKRYDAMFQYQGLDSSVLESFEDAKYDPYFFTSREEYTAEFDRRVIAGQERIDSCPVLGGPNCQDRVLGEIIGPRYRGERDERREGIAQEFKKYSSVYYGSIFSLSAFKLTLGLGGSEKQAFGAAGLTGGLVDMYFGKRTLATGATLKLGTTGALDYSGPVDIGAGRPQFLLQLGIPPAPSPKAN